MSRYASRKFLLALMSLGSCTWLALENVITTGDYKAVVIGTVGAYILGNVAQKATESSAKATNE